MNVRKQDELNIVKVFRISKPDVPLVNSTTLLVSDLGLSSDPAPFAAQLHRICLVPSHFPTI